MQRLAQRWREAQIREAHRQPLPLRGAAHHPDKAVLAWRERSEAQQRPHSQVTLPQIFPGILAGFLLAFTFSFDDFIIAFFVAGSQTTLPVYVFSSIRRGVTPEINAIGTMVLAVSLAISASGVTVRCTVCVRASPELASVTV